MCVAAQALLSDWMNQKMRRELELDEDDEDLTASKSNGPSWSPGDSDCNGAALNCVVHLIIVFKYIISHCRLRASLRDRTANLLIVVLYFNPGVTW